MTYPCRNVYTSLIIDTYKSREWKSISRSVRSGRIAYGEKLDCYSTEKTELLANIH